MAKSCFVIMPITTPLERRDSYGGDGDHFSHVLDHLITPALEAAEFDVIRPQFENSEVIHGEIIRHLAECDLVLCDISAGNTNVFFELGIRTALDKPVALIRDALTATVPFDNNIISSHQYDATLAAWTLGEEVARLKKFVEAASAQERNALWKYFGVTQTASVRNPDNPVEEKLDLLLAEFINRRDTSFQTILPSLSRGLLRSGTFSPVPDPQSLIDQQKLVTTVQGLIGTLARDQGWPPIEV